MQHHLWNCAHTTQKTRISTVFDSEHVRQGYEEAMARLDDPEIAFVEQYSAMTGTYYFFVRKDGFPVVEYDTTSF